MSVLLRRLAACDAAFSGRPFALASFLTDSSRGVRTLSAAASSDGAEASKPSKKGGKKGARKEMDTLAMTILSFIDKSSVPKPTWSKEEITEGRRRANAYSQQVNQEVRESRRRLRAKLELAAEAYHMLPPELQEEASKPDLAPYPLLRRTPRDTPPRVRGVGL